MLVRSRSAAYRRLGFGTLSDGTAVDRYVLENALGMSVSVLTYGGALQSLYVPDRAGRLANVVLGFEDLDGYTNAAYERANPYMGTLIGRYGNRIAGARFVLDGREHRLTPNDAPNCLHGGSHGFDRAVWSAAGFEESGGVGVRLSLVSPDGDQGFPGTLTVHVTYTLEGERNRLRLEYLATTDAPTVVSLTTHVHWNLAGEGSESIEDHELKLGAERYTPVDANLIPTGELANVARTPMDFREFRRIGQRLRSGFEQLRHARGYDHNWVLDGPGPAAVLRDPASGRVLAISTTEPGLQVYTDNFFDGTLYGTGGRQYRQGAGVALEPQRFPDSPNQPQFPSAVLRPGETLRSETVFDFSTEEER
jgi:aldose 1-epimerase